MITPNTTMGAELEFSKIGTAATVGLEKWLQFSTYNDGSLRDATYIAGNIAVYPQEDERGRPILSIGMREQNAYGLEIVTSPYPYAQFIPVMQKAAQFFGHIPQNSRASIHIHVDMLGETWREIRNVLIWAHALEAVIYRVASTGNIHRGCRSYQGAPNDHKFARPLSDPIGVYWHSRVKPLIDWPRLVAAETASEFLSAWGRLDASWSIGMEHYVPHRLHMVNLTALMRQGTLEWRVFDGIYRYVDIFVEFVYRIHRLANSGQMPDFVFPLGSSPEVDATWVSKLLDMDVSLVWGDNWQKGCTVRTPLSHYSNQPHLHTFTDLPVQNIAVNGRRDTGENDFVLISRR